MIIIIYSKYSTKDTGSIVEPQANTSTGFHPELGVKDIIFYNLSLAYLSLLRQESEVALIKACEKLDKDKMKHLVIWNSANPNVWSQVNELHYLDNRLLIAELTYDYRNKLFNVTVH